MVEFDIKKVPVEVKGVNPSTIKDRALVFNGEVIRYVKNSFNLIEPNAFLNGAKEFVEKNFPKLTFESERKYSKAYAQAIHFDIALPKNKQNRLINKLQLVIFNSYICDYNLGIGLNIVLNGGGEFMLNDWDTYPTLKKLDLEIINTLDKLKPSIEDLLTNKITSTLNFFNSNDNSFGSTEKFIQEFYQKKSNATKYISNVSSIESMIEMSEILDKSSHDVARMIGIIRYFYNHVTDKNTDDTYYFFNMYYKKNTKKITEYIWRF